MRNISKKSIQFAKIALIFGLFGAFPIYTYALSPTLSFSITPQNVVVGEAATLSWFAENVSYCDASGAWGGHYRDIGSMIIFPSETNSYYITCNGSYGIVSDVKTLYVNQKSPSSPTVIYSQPTSNSGSGSGLIPVPNTPIPIAPQANTFTAACATSPSATETNKIVSFAAAYTGGFAPVVYRWSGDIIGSQQVENVAFEHAGVKTAKITVTDSRGLSAEGQCSATISATASSPAPTPAPIITTKKTTAIVTEARAPTCKTVTICMDTSGNIIQKDGNAIQKKEPKIETAQNSNGSNGKKFFLASLFGAGNGNGNGNNENAAARNFIVYLLPVFAAAFLIFIGYMVVKMSKRV